MITKINTNQEQEITTFNYYTAGYVEPIPGEFTVTENGQLCMDYYEALYDRQLREARIDAAKRVATILGHSLKAVAVGIGSAAMEYLDAAAEAGREKPMIQS